jgi:hypothetical protein
MFRLMRGFFLVTFIAILPGLSTGEPHWAYAPPVSAPQPAAGTHPIDVLVTAAQAESGLKPAPLAAPRRWIERAAFTLTGLPPS